MNATRQNFDDQQDHQDDASPDLNARKTGDPSVPKKPSRLMSIEISFNPHEVFQGRRGIEQKPKQQKEA